MNDDLDLLKKALKRRSSDAETLDPRRAGEIERYHTWPKIRRQTNAAHQWNVARILLAIWPEVSIALLKHALFHDIGEILTGDPPYPVKKDNPIIKAEFDKLEASARLRMSIPWGIPALHRMNDWERVLLKLCDYIEMWEYALGEVSLGNSCSHLVVERCEDAIADQLMILDPFFHKRTVDYITRRQALHRRIMGDE